MKIIFVSEYFPPEPNAAATRVHEHVRRWAAHGHDVTVVTGVPNFPQGEVHPGYRNRWHQAEMMNGVRVVRVKTFIHPNRGRFRRILDQSSFFPTALIAVMRQKKPDVIVASSPTLFAALAAGIAAFFHRRPFVLEIGDLGSASIAAVGAMQSGILLRTVQWLERFVYGRTERIVVQTSSVARELVFAGVDPTKIEQISNGVDTRRFTQRAKPPATVSGESPFVAGYIGTLGMAHGLESVIEAAGMLRTDRNIVFKLVGDGAARPALEKTARTRELENVIFRGPFPHEQMPAVWTSIDLAIVCLKNHPTFETVVPSKIFEAMACGIPILLAAPAGEATALVRQHDIGTVIPPEDPAAMTDAVRRLAASPDILHAQAEHCLQAVSQYDRESKAKRYLDVLARVIESGRST